MAEYTLNLKLKETDESYNCKLQLSAEQRNNPENVFTLQKRQEIRRTLESKSECSINEQQLEYLVSAWILDIQEDYRDTFVTMDLPSLLLSNISVLQEQGYQAIPSILPPSIQDIEPTLGMMPPLDFW
jgi:hypothetical protein